MAVEIHVGNIRDGEAEIEVWLVPEEGHLFMNHDGSQVGDFVAGKPNHQFPIETTADYLHRWWLATGTIHTIGLFDADEVIERELPGNKPGTHIQLHMH